MKVELRTKHLTPRGQWGPVPIQGYPESLDALRMKARGDIAQRTTATPRLSLITAHCCLLIAENCINAALWYHKTACGRSFPPDQVCWLMDWDFNNEETSRFPWGLTRYKPCTTGSNNAFNHQVCSGSCHTHPSPHSSYWNLPCA